jgi:hypothetical protein
MEEFFNIDIFLKRYNLPYEETKVETKQIAQWVNCTLRHIQKWAIKNNVEFISKEGRKYYLWNETKLREFAVYYNRNYNKPKIYYYSKWDKCLPKIKEKLNFGSMRESIVNSILIKELHEINKENNYRLTVGLSIEILDKNPDFIARLQEAIDDFKYHR